ncbi:MAG: polysaccharide deacetylase family protein [Glaciimonas sp.]|nr:polysaccharide deacetylase family protein [Glaciimonas sp.]
MKMLSELGWKSLSVDEFTSILIAGRSLPFRSFLITFDDGYESVKTTALKILQEFNFKAICFLSTALMRNSDENQTSQISETDQKFLSWSQVRELQSSGNIDCQSHSHTHNRFINFSLTEIQQDLGTSVDLLSHELRLPKDHFTHLAWPWGLSFQEWKSIASHSGFKYQYTVARQSLRPDSHFDQIPRTCFDTHTLSQFKRLLWLQTGLISPVWDYIYPHRKKVRRIIDYLNA